MKSTAHRRPRSRRSHRDDLTCNTDNLTPGERFTLFMLIGKISAVTGEGPGHASNNRSIHWLLPLEDADRDHDEIPGQRITVEWDDGELAATVEIESDDPSDLMLSVMGLLAFRGVPFNVVTCRERFEWASKQDWSLPEPQEGETQEQANLRRWHDLCMHGNGPYPRPPRGTPLREFVDSWLEAEAESIYRTPREERSHETKPEGTSLH